MVYGFGLLLGLAALLGCLLVRGRMADSPRLLKLAAWAWPLPFLINSAGWVMTEMGRQPWIVQGLLKTNGAQSPSVSTLEVWISLLGYTPCTPSSAASPSGSSGARRARARHEGAPAGPGDADLSLAY